MKAFDYTKQKMKAKKGMTLVEVLVAMALLVLIILTFTPLFAQYYRNIYKAGEVNKQTYEKSSLLERVLASKGEHLNTYETSPDDVPLTLTIQGTANSISFSTNDDNAVGKVSGYSVTSDYKNGGTNSYTTFYTNAASAGLYCFPNTLNDDFETLQIRVVAKGFTFSEDAVRESDELFKVYYTNSNNNLVKINYSSGLYSIDNNLLEDNTVAVFTFKGANDTICFQNSPLVIKYGAYEVKVEIGAPTIIMVGEGVKSNTGTGDYFYYATSGLQDDGTVSIIAKSMSKKNADGTVDNSANLNSAMNDVEWVEPGQGDDGNGGVNEYGYYVMGGDNGQVRRFWKMRDYVAGSSSENYCWGGDNLVNYISYNDAEDSSKNVFSMNNQLTTTANTEFSYRANPGGSNMVSLITYNSGAYSYRFYTTNFFTVTAKDQASFGGSKIYYGGTKFEDISVFNASRHSKYHVDYVQSSPYNATSNGLSDYRITSGNSDTVPISITSVAAISLNAANKSAYKSDNAKIGVAYESSSQQDYAHVTVNQEAYPQQSYTLYCGTIPAVMDLYGRHYNSSNYSYLATLGAFYNTALGRYVVSGLFGDQNVGSFTTRYGTSYSSMWDLLRYVDHNTSGDQTITPGFLLGKFYQDSGITSNKVVDITIGYLSQPFANSTKNLQALKGENTSQYFSNSNYNHSFFGTATREFSTFLDMASYNDDCKGASFSIAVGYGLGILGFDARGFTRIGEIYNVGTIYIRASGDGTGDNDTINNQLDSGRGWSMMQESNVFHPYYGIDQYAEGDDYYSYATNSGYASGSWVTTSFGNNNQSSAHGWADNLHRQKFNLSTSSNSGASLVNESSHVLAQTRCTTVACGINGYDCPEFMVGTENGTLLSWYFDYSVDQSNNKNRNKISRAMTKEFENYTWSDTLGSKSIAIGGNYDYWSLTDNTTGTYGFISVLECVNDVGYGDGYWVATGDQSTKAPNAYCSSAAYSGSGDEASYINVRYSYKADNGLHYAWKAIKIDNGKKSDSQGVNIVSITYCQGIWYATGYIDSNKDGEYTTGEQGVFYYAKDPTRGFGEDNGWKKGPTTATYYDENGNKNTISLGGINSMASQG